MITLTIQNFRRVIQKRYLATLGYFQIHQTNQATSNTIQLDRQNFYQTRASDYRLTSNTDLKFSVRHRTDRMQISASPPKKLVVLQFVKLLTTKDDQAIFIIRPWKIDCWFPLTWEHFHNPTGRLFILIFLIFISLLE